MRLATTLLALGTLALSVLALGATAPAARAQFTPETATVLEGDITTNRTLTNDRAYLLRGFVRVMEGATLTIQPGTIIYGERPIPGQRGGGTLIVMRGARIMAEGTPDRPIVFTSTQPPGQREPGDWGGIILLGRARINTSTGTLPVEGVPESVGAIGGGGASPNDDDDSGVMRYVRLEFGGEELSPNNEINGLTMAGVGRGTRLEYIQVSYNDDDAFEWFGGTVNGRYFITLGNIDDDFDSDLGWRGNVQFGLIVRDPVFADNVGASNAFETDSSPNDATAVASPFRSEGNFSNVTVIGPIGQADTFNPAYQNGILLRTGTRTSIYNSIVMGFPTGLRINGQPAVEEAQANRLQVRNTLLTGGFATNQTGFDVEAWFRTEGWGNRTATSVDDVGLENPFLFRIPADRRQAEFDPRPRPGSLAATTAPSFDNPRLPQSVPGGVPGLFERTTYVGAFAPGGARWDLPWAEYDPQNRNYAQGAVSTEPEAGPTSFRLEQNHPNPFATVTMVEFRLERPQHVRLAVYDLLGREVAVLHDGLHPAGNGFFRFDASHLAAGTYLYRLESEDGVATRRMTLTK